MCHIPMRNFEMVVAFTTCDELQKWGRHPYSNSPTSKSNSNHMLLILNEVALLQWRERQLSQVNPIMFCHVPIDFWLSHCYLTPVPVHLQVYPMERGPIFFARRGIIEQWWSWLGPLVHPLGVLWLNGNVDCLLMGFLTSGLVSGAPNGWPLGQMAPYPVYML